MNDYDVSWQIAIAVSLGERICRGTKQPLAGWFLPIIRRETASDSCTPTRSLPLDLLGLPLYTDDWGKYLVSDVRRTKTGRDDGQDSSAADSVASDAPERNRSGPDWRTTPGSSGRSCNEVTLRQAT